MNTLRTVASPAAFSGVGLHSGAPVSAVVRPAPPGSGVVFRRVDLAGAPLVRASWDSTGGLTLCTTLVSGGASVATVEHLMAALAGCGVDDALIDVDGPEVPAMDGSAEPFAAGLAAAGFRASAAPRRWLRVLEAVEVAEAGWSARLEPWDGFVVSFEIDFPHPSVGRSTVSVDVGRDGLAPLARARTFAFEAEVERMRALGFARGGSLDNAVVVGEGGILNSGGLRYADEFVRHKALDAVGDLALAGGPILGRYVGRRCGHAANNALLRALFADPSSWCWSTGAMPAAA